MGGRKAGPGQENESWPFHIWGLSSDNIFVSFHTSRIPVSRTPPYQRAVLEMSNLLAECLTRLTYSFTPPALELTSNSPSAAFEIETLKSFLSKV